MESEPAVSNEPVYQLPDQRRRVPRVAVGVGLTAFLALGGAGMALAFGSGGSPSPAAVTAGSSGTTSTTTPAREMPGPERMRHFGFGFGGPFGGLGGPGAVVHGQFTVKSGSTYKTVSVQVGQVKSVSSGSIAVTSTDGYSQTYQVKPATIVDSQSGGISAVAKGDSVIIEGLVQGGTSTATNVVDTTKIGSSRQGFGFGNPPAGFGPGGLPEPAQPGASSSSASWQPA